MKSEFALEWRVEPSDVDASGAMSFAAYTRVMERAKADLLASTGFATDALSALGVSLRRVHADFDFFKPASVGDVLTVSARVAGVGAHSLRVKIDVLRGADQAQTASGTLVAACVDGDNRSISMPPALAEALRARLAPD